MSSEFVDILANEKKEDGGFVDILDPSYKEELLGAEPVKKEPLNIPFVPSISGQKFARPREFADKYLEQLSPFAQTGEEVPMEGAIEMLGGQEISKPLKFREPGFYAPRPEDKYDIDAPVGDYKANKMFGTIRQGKEKDFASVSGAIKKSIYHFINEYGAGLPGYVGEKLTGEPVVEEAKSWEKIPVGLAGTAGFIMGAPGQLFKYVVKGLIKAAPKLALKAGEGVTKRVLKGAAKEAPGLGAASMLAQTGEALKQDNLGDSLDILGEAFVGGAVTGTIFAGTRGTLWRDQKDRIMRLTVGLGLLNASRGTHPFDDRDLAEKFYEGGIDTFFLWRGLPRRFVKLEKEVTKEIKEKGLEKELETIVEKGVKRESKEEVNLYESLNLKTVKEDAGLGVRLAQEELVRRKEKAKEKRKKIKKEKEEAKKIEEKDIPIDIDNVKVVKSETASKDGTYLKKTRELKKKIGDKIYYEILAKLGIEKANQVKGRKDKAIILKALEDATKKVEPKVKKEKVKIPEFKDTVEAIAFGKKATPEQIEELKRLREKGIKKTKSLNKKFKESKDSKVGETAIKEAARTQFFREALEWKEGEKTLKKITDDIEKPKAKIKEVKKPSGEKIPEDVNTQGREIVKDIKAFREGEKIDIDKIEERIDDLSFSKDREDFKNDQEYEDFISLNRTLLDLVHKAKEEKGIKTSKKSEEPAEKDELEELLDAEKFNLPKEKKLEEELRPEEEGYVDEEGRPRELIFDNLGLQQIYEKSVKDIKKISKKIKGRVIKTFNTDQSQILRDIMHLHIKGMIEADFTYSKGIMWKEFGKKPKKKFDLNPQTSDTIKADTTNLKNIENSSIESIMFDPIFLVKGKRIKPTKSKMVNRFGGFETVDDLWRYNKKSLSEFFRILKPGGKLVIKTQDIIQKQAFFTSSEMYNHAVSTGFKPIDRFIYGRTSQMPLAPNIKKQKHARKAHVDFWVFEKPKRGYKHPKESGVLFDFMGGQQAYEGLRRISRGVMLEGKTKYGEFRTRVKEIVGDSWNSVKDFVRQFWNEAKEWYNKTEKSKDVALDAFGGQQIYEKVINRLSSKSKEQHKLTKEAIKKRDKKIGKASELDIEDINQIGMARGFSKNEIKKIADNTFGWRTKLENLNKEDADILKLKLAKNKPKKILENEKLIYADKSILDTTKEALKRSVKLYEVDDIELGDYITMFKKGDKLDNEGVKGIISTIGTVNDLRPDRGRVIWGYLAPAKRLFGDKFMSHWRRGVIKKMEDESPYIMKNIKMNEGLSERSLKDITKHFDGKLEAKDLSPEELKAAKGIREIYNELWKTFEIDKFIEDYSPRLPEFDSKQDMVDWAFSRKGVKEFDFWAEHERTGELWEGELNAKKLLMRYIRTGFAKKYYGEALENVEPILKEMSKERKQMASKWIDTVIRKRPTAGEIVANRMVRKVLEKAGVKVDESKRYFKDIVGEALDLNYSAYMGLRPKLAIRNLTQQWLIANEYGYGNYLKGRLGKYQSDVREALERSDVYKLRKKQYLVMEERVNDIKDIPSEVRQKMMWFYRMADLDNVETAFATGYLKARELHPNLTEGYAIRAGEKAVHNTQWGYGIDLPYMFKTPGGKFLGQYMSWPIWYLDHIGRIVKEKHGSKAARTILQAGIIGMIANTTDFDYTRTVLFGAMPTSLGYGPSSVLNFVKLGKSLGTWDTKNIEQAGKDAGDIILGLIPGYLAARDIRKFAESGDVSEYLLYKKKGKKGKGGLEGL